jgi:hypothetical protein
MSVATLTATESLLKNPPTAAGAPERIWPRCGSPNSSGHVGLGYTLKFWGSRAMLNTPGSTLAAHGNLCTSPEAPLRLFKISVGKY